MKHVKVTELRQKLPEYLAKVRRGERIRVTSRGRVIAEIAPPAAAKDEAAGARARPRGRVRRYERPLHPGIDPGGRDADKRSCSQPPPSSCVGRMPRSVRSPRSVPSA